MQRSILPIAKARAMANYGIGASFLRKEDDRFLHDRLQEVSPDGDVIV
jgi:hypothetical protein